MRKMTASTLVKSSGGNYQTRNDSPLKVGDRVVIQPENLSQRRQYLAHAIGEIKSITGTKASVLLDEPANQAYKPHTVKVDLCSLIWISSRESEDFQKQQKQLEELGQLNLLNSIQMLKESCDRASLVSPFTAISKTIPPELENTNYLPWASPAPAPALQATELDSITQNLASGLKPCGASLTASPISPSSKILRGLSVEDFEQCLEDCEWSDIVGTIHKSFQQRNSERRTSAKGFSSLPTPTTYAKGSTGSRPAGATRLEQSLRKFIAKGDKLSPAAPGWMMGFPPGWVEEILMAGGAIIQPPITPECDRILPNVENVTTSTPDPSVPSKLRSPLEESCTSCPSCESPLLTLADGCGVCGWLPIPPELKRKRPASGWLEHYTKNKKLKDGTIATFPKVEGRREPDNPEHWYWAYKYEEKNSKAKSPNGFITRAVSVPSSKVCSVRYAIASRWSVAKILEFVRGS